MILATITGHVSCLLDSNDLRAAGRRSIGFWPSTSNHLNYRVQIFQFDAGLLVCKLPISFHMMFVSMIEPS